MAELILIRHCETDLTEARRYGGWIDSPLSSQGRKRADELGRWLPARIPPDVPIWCSDLARARETASRAIPDRNARPDPRLREMDFGAYSGHTYEENLEKFGSAFRRWVADPREHAPPGGEAFSTFEDRILNWLRDASSHLPAVAVTHGGGMRVLIALSLGVSFGSTFRCARSPASVVRVGPPAEPERGCLLNWSSTGTDIATNPGRDVTRE